jgi:hypothetical protein
MSAFDECVSQVELSSYGQRERHGLRRRNESTLYIKGYRSPANPLSLQARPILRDANTGGRYWTSDADSATAAPSSRLIQIWSLNTIASA